MSTPPDERAPLISVLMGVYCRSADTAPLERSVQSILRQSCADFELLICADGSTGEALRVLRQFAQTDRRIRLLPEISRRDLAAKLNACLRQARGALLARMDDDDYSEPERFARQAAFLRERPEIGFVGCSVRLRQNGKPAGVRRLPPYPTVRDFLFVQPYIHPSLMFRREALLAANGYSEEKRCVKCEDYDLLLRLYELGVQGANLPECLLEYTVSANGNRAMPDRWNEAAVRLRHFQRLGLLPKALPYVAKPVLVGLLPVPVLQRMKARAAERRNGAVQDE